MIVHSILLLFQSFVAIIYAILTFGLLKNWFTPINIFVTAVDILVQIAICFICLTMGSSEKIRKFKMTLDLTNPKAPNVIFIHK
jgi:hypothetical protein